MGVLKRDVSAAGDRPLVAVRRVPLQVNRGLTALPVVREVRWDTWFRPEEEIVISHKVDEVMCLSVNVGVGWWIPGWVMGVRIHPDDSR